MASSLTSATGSLTRIGGGSNKLFYPSPFFDIASQFMPSSVRDMFCFCEYYYKTHWLFHQAITKMSEYPITDLIVEDDDTKLAKKWEEFFNDNLDYRTFLVGVLLDRYTYGIAYPAPFFPFVKTLICARCKEEYRADETMKDWEFSNYKFRLSCPKCKNRADALVEDRMPKNIEKLKLVRWSPHNVLIVGSEYGSYYYFYEVPKSMQNTWILGQKHRVVNTPQQFITGVKENKLIVVNQDNLFPMRRAAVSGMDTAYGVPLMMPLLKDAFLFQIFKRTNEMLMLECAVPWRTLFPQAASAGADPSIMVNLKDWKRQVEDTVMRWKLDPAYVGILGWPLGQEKIGGDAKIFLMGEEMRRHMELLLAGMGVPSELLFGGLSYSGSNVSLKILENQFINLRTDLKKLTMFLMRRISAYIGWRPAREVSFRPFKMADDLQRKMFYMQLNAANKLSDTTLLAECDMDSAKEDALMEQEHKRRQKSVKEQQLATAEIQAEIQAVLQKHGIKTQFDLQRYSQRLMQQEGGDPANAGAPGGGVPNMALDQQVQEIAGKLMLMPEGQRAPYLQQLTGQYPQIGSMVGQLVQRMQASGQGSSMMKPMPEKLPPRRLAQ